MASYRLICRACGKHYEDDSEFRLVCDGETQGEHGPALLSAEYASRQLRVRTDLPGVFEYIDWLPTDNYYFNPPNFSLGKPFTYKSEGLAQRLGLKSLQVAFSGYWPERGPKLLTRSFKEFEAQASLARYLAINRNGSPPPFIVASAGNTANGYNLLSHVLNLPLYLSVPETGLEKLLLPMETNPFVILVQGDYSDATDMANAISELTGLARDGGVKNIARRAALGIVMLNAVAHPGHGSGELYDHYFQAVGSASGAIAVWEANDLLRQDGRFGKTNTKIHLAQNSPFTPIPDAWNASSSEVASLEDNLSRERVASVTASVLTTRHPPYSIAGGIYDMLKATNGMTWRVSNFEVFQSSRMFREIENVDIGPAAAVAVGALCQAVETGAVRPDDKILLHITGGGKEIQYSEGQVHSAVPKVVIKVGDVSKAVEALGSPQPIQNPRASLMHLGS